MATLRIENSTEVMDTIYYAEHLKVGQSVGVKVDENIYVITKEKRNLYVVTKNDVEIAKGNAIWISGEIDADNNSWRKRIELEQKLKDGYAKRLAEDPDYYNPKTIYATL